KATREHKGVVAGTAVQGVGPSRRDQRIVAAAADQGLAAATTATQRRPGRAHDVNGLDIGRSGVITHVAQHRIVALARVLDPHIGGIVDIVDVVARATHQAIGTGPAVELIVAGKAVERVITWRAGEGIVVAVAVDYGPTAGHVDGDGLRIRQAAV